MSKIGLQLKFDGPALKGHSMDAAELATSLLSLSNLIKESNTVLNDGKATVKVLINADIKANCVTIDLSVVFTLAQQLHSFIENAQIKDAKELLDLLGLLGFPTAGAACYGLFQFLAAKGKKQVESAVQILDQSGDNHIQVKFVGDNNTIIVSPQVYKLAKDKRVVDNAKAVLAPLSKNKGVESATFIHGKRKNVIDINEARRIRESTIDEEQERLQYIEGHIIVYAPILEADAKSWKFLYNGNVETIDISETSIASETIARGSVLVGDTYKVKLGITEKKTENGYKNTFKVVEVLNYIPGDEQQRLF